MDTAIISMIVSIVFGFFSLVFAILKILQNSKNKKIAQSAQTALDTLYAVRDAMFAVEDKDYKSEDKEIVALSLAKESCRESKIACSNDGLKSAVEFVMEIGNTINKRKEKTPDANSESNAKIGIVVEQNSSSDHQNKKIGD